MKTDTLCFHQQNLRVFSMPFQLQYCVSVQHWHGKVTEPKTYLPGQANAKACNLGIDLQIYADCRVYRVRGYFGILKKNHV